MPRSVWLLREQERADSHNDGTLLMPAICALERPRRHEPGSFEELFRRHYAPIRSLLDTHREPGLALLVASGDDIEASAWVGTEPDAINPLIVGRHNAAEIFLPLDPALSLRHLAVVLERRAEGPVRFRVLDLRTPTAFLDEQGRRLEGVEAAGPLLLRCASYAILLFPTGAPGEPWPDDAEAGWRRVPPRVWVAASSADRDQWAPFAPALDVESVALSSGAATLDTTSISFPGPAFVSSRALGTGPARGELVLACGRERASLRLDKEAVRQGVLLGRYDRCDGADLPLLRSPGLSRVHLLVIEVGGALYAVDTASHNGTLLGERPIRSARLEPGRRVTLPVNVTVEWQPFH